MSSLCFVGQIGDSCGVCNCPPSYSAGDCASGLTCQPNEDIPDAPGKCVKPLVTQGECEGYSMFYISHDLMILCILKK